MGAGWLSLAWLDERMIEIKVGGVVTNAWIVMYRLEAGGHVAAIPVVCDVLSAHSSPDLSSMISLLLARFTC